MISFISSPRVYKEVKSKLQPRTEEVLSSSVQFQGKYTQACEELLKDLTGRKHAFMTTSGTSSIMVMLMTQGIQPGDEVITTNYSCPATVMPVKALGAVPVFIDINEHGQQNFHCINDLITDKTKSVLATGLYGDCYDHDLLLSKTNLPVLNDSAQSFLAKYKGQESTKFGTMSILSFSTNKNCPIFGTYGAVLTDDDELAEKIKFIRRNGYLNRDVGLAIQYVGINAQPQEDKCAQVLTSLEFLHKWQQRRKEIFEYYDENFKNLVMLRKSPENSERNFHKYTIFVKDKYKYRDKMINDGVECQLHYTYNFQQTPILSNDTTVQMPGTEYYRKHAISIPAHPWLTHNEQSEVIKKVIKNYDYN